MHIARNGQNIGSWPASQIRHLVLANQLLLTDHFYDEDDQTWRQLLPPPRRRTLVFDWAGEDDRLWFYIKDGFIHGPREADEIDALYKAEYIPGSTLLCVLGAEEWFTYDSLLESESDAAEPDQEHFDAARNQLKQGNLLGAALNLGAYLVSATTPTDPVLDAKPVQPASKLPASKPDATGDSHETQKRPADGPVPTSAEPTDGHMLTNGVCLKCGCSEAYIDAHHPSCNADADKR